MSKWKHEVDEDGNVWLDLGFWKPYLGDMEDLDKEHFDAISLMEQAPELLNALEILLNFTVSKFYPSGGEYEKAIAQAKEAIALAKNEALFSDETSNEMEW